MRDLDAKFFPAGLIPGLMLVLTAALGLQAGEWEVLFDGKSTAEFRGYQKDAFPAAGWRVEEGALQTVAGKGEDIISRKKYADFELELEWKVSPGANSGVMYRVIESGAEPWHTGPEMQVLDDAQHKDGKNVKTSAGSLYALIAPSSGKVLKPVGDWNQARVVLKGGRAEHWLNGVKIVEYEWSGPEVKALIAQSKFADKPRFMLEAEGHIVLQHHGDAVWFRNVRIRSL